MEHKVAGVVVVWCRNKGALGGQNGRDGGGGGERYGGS